MKRIVSMLLSLVMALCLFTAAGGSALAAPTVTKDPVGDTISVGATEILNATADNAAEITWYLIAPGGVSYEAEQVVSRFPDMVIVGQGTGTLTLFNVPSGFTGWQAECHFKDVNGEETISQRTTVTVNEQLPAAPTITREPEHAWLAPGGKTTLTVYAEAPAGYTVTYEWFSSETNDLYTAMKIPDATSAEYTPPEVDGTVYYWVGMKSVGSEGMPSTKAYSQAVPVTYSTEPEVPDHVHTFSDEWASDEVYHWHVCSGCGEIGDRATHAYTGTETVKPTSRKQGERVGVCSVCGYETTQVIPAQSSQRSSSGKGLLVALLVLVIALLAAGAYYYVRYYRTGTRFEFSDITRRFSGGGKARSRAAGNSRGRHAGGYQQASPDDEDKEEF